MDAASVRCPSCGDADPGDASFCDQCGARVRCPNGHPLEEAGLRFCEACGAAMEGPNEVPSAPAALASAGHGKLFLLIGAAVVALGGIAGFGAFALLGDGGGGGDEAAEAGDGFDERTREPTSPGRGGSPVATPATATVPPRPATASNPASTAVATSPPATAVPTAAATQPPAVTPTAVPPTSVPSTAVPPTPVPPTAVPTLAATVVVVPTVQSCFAVTVVNPGPCRYATAPADASCVAPGKFVGLALWPSDVAMFKEWVPPAGITLSTSTHDTAFQMPNGPVTITLSCGP